MDKKRRNILTIAGVGILSLSLIVSGIVLQVIRSEASIGLPAQYEVHQLHQEALFTQSGINQNVVNAIHNMLESTHIGGANQTRNAGHFSNFATADVAQTHGGVYVRLFDHNINPAGEVAGAQTTNINLFTRSGNVAHGTVDQARWWRVVYLRNGVLTLWMADPYRNSAFNTNTGVVSGINANVFYDPARPSNVHQNLTADFDAVMDAITNTNARNRINAAIVPAGDPLLAGTNTNETQINTSRNTQGTLTNPAVPTGDRVWLPSFWEIGNNTANPAGLPEQHWQLASGATNRHGAWQVTAYDTGYSPGGFNPISWLRSSHTTMNAMAGFIWSDGQRGWDAVTFDRGVRPAIHIDISALEGETSGSISAGFEGNAGNEARVSSPGPGGAASDNVTVGANKGVGTQINFDAGPGHRITNLTIHGQNVNIASSSNVTRASVPNAGTTEFRAWFTDSTHRHVRLYIYNLDSPQFDTTPIQVLASIQAGYNTGGGSWFGNNLQWFLIGLGGVLLLILLAVLLVFLLTRRREKNEKTQ